MSALSPEADMLIVGIKCLLSAISRQHVRTFVDPRTRIHAYTGQESIRKSRVCNRAFAMRAQSLTAIRLSGLTYSQRNFTHAFAIYDKPHVRICLFGANWSRTPTVVISIRVNVTRSGEEQPTQAQITELVPLGSFATWQAERAVGDHDRNTLRLRQHDQAGFVPGMTVFIKR